MMSRMQGEHPERDERDAQLEALLDEALSPEQPQPGLNERLVRAGMAASAAAREEAAQPLTMPSRSATWLSRATPLAIAAAIALAMFGAWVLFEAGDATEPTSPEGMTDVTGVTGVAVIERELGDLDRAAAARINLSDPFDSVDEQIELLALQLEMTQLGPIWPTGEPLDAVAGDARTYHLMHEWDLAWVY